MVDVFCTYYQHLHSDLRITLPFLCALPGVGFATPMGLGHRVP